MDIDISDVAAPVVDGDDCAATVFVTNVKSLEVVAMELIVVPSIDWYKRFFCKLLLCWSVWWWWLLLLLLLKWLPETPVNGSVAVLL